MDGNARRIKRNLSKFVGHLPSMHCQMLQAGKYLPYHTNHSGSRDFFQYCLLPRPSSETLAVSNPLKDICFENLPENLPRSIRVLARDLRPAENATH